MGKVSEVQVSYGVTCNIGNFENVKIDVQVKAQVDPDEKASEVLDKLYEYTKSYVQKRAAETYAQFGKQEPKK